MYRRLLFAIIFVGHAVLAEGQIYYSDGGTHTVASVAPEISLSNATTLDVVDGAAITGSAIGLTGQSGLVAEDGYPGTDNIINITGGSVIGGSDTTDHNFVAGHGVDSWRGTLNVSAGQLVGGNSDWVAGSGAYTFLSNVTVSGGTFQGGSSPEVAGDGLDISGGASLISGGNFYGGNGFGGGAGLAFGVMGGNLDPVTYGLVTGGSFYAGVGVPYRTSYCFDVGYNFAADVDVEGGAFNGPILVEVGSILNLYGTNFTSSAEYDPDDQQYDIYHVTGILLDGTPFDSDITIIDDPSGTINFFPEPNGTALGGLFGLMAAGRKRRTK